jgi:hypothetical protein
VRRLTTNNVAPNSFCSQQLSREAIGKGDVRWWARQGSNLGPADSTVPGLALGSPLCSALRLAQMVMHWLALKPLAMVHLSISDAHLEKAYNLAKLGVIKDLGELLELTIDELSQ